MSDKQEEEALFLGGWHDLTTRLVVLPFVAATAILLGAVLALAVLAGRGLSMAAYGIYRRLA